MRLEISREDEQLLDTGGGLKKAAWFFQENPTQADDPFILHNVDILTNIDLHAMLQFHTERHALATLAVQSRQSSRQLLFTPQLQLAGRRIHNQDEIVSTAAADVASAKICHSERSEESAFSSYSPLATNHSPLPQSKTHSDLLPLAFSGIHILSPCLLPQLTESRPFSIIDAYLRLAAQSQKIQAFRLDHSYWRVLGKAADLTQAAQDLQQKILPS